MDEVDSRRGSVSPLTIPLLFLAADTLPAS